MTPSKVTYTFTAEDIKKMLIQSVDLDSSNKEITCRFIVENVVDRGNTEYQLTEARVELIPQKRD